MIKGQKISGPNIEDTHVVILERLEQWMLLVMIAFVRCYRIGDFIDTHLRPLKIKKHGRRAVSVYRYGLGYPFFRALLTGGNELNINGIQLLLCT